MAEFCNQCAKELGFPEGDFKKDLSTMNFPANVEELLKRGIMGFHELCESCDHTMTDLNGNCTAHYCEIHGEENTNQWWKDRWAGR